MSRHMRKLRTFILSRLFINSKKLLSKKYLYCVKTVLFRRLPKGTSSLAEVFITLGQREGFARNKLLTSWSKDNVSFFSGSTKDRNRTNCKGLEHLSVTRSLCCVWIHMSFIWVGFFYKVGCERYEIISERNKTFR